MRLPWLQGEELPLYLAPMAGFTDKPFRQLCKEHGADVMVTEFVMCNRFLDQRSEADAWKTVDFSPEQRPMGVQIFGGEPDKMAEAARRIVDKLQPDFLDINYGCPAPKVVNNRCGSSLLRDLPLLQAVAKAVVDAVGADCPVTAKIRIGWDDSSIVAPEAARMLEAVGIEAIAVHGRTKEQGYRGRANWDVIHAVADHVSIPVIGNGSIETVADVEKIRAAGKVKGLMIGRAALGYPWIFNQIKTCLRTGQMPPPPEPAERWEVLLRYCRDLNNHEYEDGPWEPLNWMRARLKSFTKVMPGSKQLRQQLDKVETYEQLEILAEQHLAEIQTDSIVNE